ncbi:glucosaminidase domain-containing protein [Clostridium sp. Sa3CUN1]|uniref:Glucosaminidase domain-containing protein n=1 Tax=Clostridium gallinarum TaxID=2762246 RepID=A0ABR8Q5D0_9CLOT|nr:glucosaminidase domain-containing protein [Clostridium gallinarum]
MYKIKKVFLFSIIFSCIIGGINVKAEVNIGEKYETVKISDMGYSFYNFMDEENTEDKYVDEEVIEKLKSMEDYSILITKTDSNYEVALAYSDGSFTFIDAADTLEEAKEKLEEIVLPQSEDTIIPSIIGKNGQVVYATNSMGRVWKHIDNVPDTTINNISYIYSSADRVGNENLAYTYINHGYIDDVPIIEDRGTVAKIQVNGYEGWINKDDTADDYDLVVVPINQVKDPSCYLVQNGYLYHYITRNMTSSIVTGNSLRLGPAPDYLEEGKDYYSYDGVYFYEGNTIEEGLNKLITDLKNNVKDNSINKDNPYYNYYKYLPFRTRTNYTSDELNKFINENTSAESKLRGIGEVLIECQNTYGVNALLTLGVAINESTTQDGWGMSDYAQNYNNLFGIGAVDFAPDGANRFESPSDSIREFTKNYISAGYSNPDDYRYYGGYLGNKALGANVKYASDPFWGEKAAQHAFTIELGMANGELNNLKDYNGYQLAMYFGENQVISKSGSLLYNINSKVSGFGGYSGNVIALLYEEKNSKDEYEIFPEVNSPINGNGYSSYNGIYDWNSRAYINSSNIKLINKTKSSFIPGYKKEDVNKDDIIDIQDISELALKYNISQDNKIFLRRLDINLDGIIDIFDMVNISKYIN